MMPNDHSSPSSDTILIPNDFDILCGSGKAVSAHPGNQRFQAIVNKYYPSYAVSSLSKSMKMQITHDVMGDIMSSGCTRFLKKDPIYERYYVAASRVGKDKVSHCLRDMKMTRDRQDRRRQSPTLRRSSYQGKQIIQSKEVPTLQGYFLHNYNTLQQPSMHQALTKEGPFSPCGPPSQSQQGGSPALVCNTQGRGAAPTVRLDSGHIFSSLFPAHQQPAALVGSNVLLQKEEQHLLVHHDEDDEDIYRSILDTLKCW
jgi:hypothetical protein